MKIYILFFVSVFILGGCTAHKVYRESTMVPKPYHAPAIDSDVKERYVVAINKVRSQGRSCGGAGNFSSAPALRWSDALYKAAYEHSRDMSFSDSFGHDGSQKNSDWTANVQHLKRGSSFKERIDNNGYKKWKNIAENIAMGSPTLDMVMAQWLASDRHCANIMNSDFTDVGMAHFKQEDSQRSYYWTQNFAAHQ